MQIEEISLAEAKARFSELVNRVAYGREQIVITRHGKPVAILSAPSGKGLGSVKGWLNSDDAFIQEIESYEKTRHNRKLRANRL